MILAAIPFVTLIIGCIAEMCRVKGAMMIGMITSLVIICIGVVLVTLESAGPVAAVGGIVFATIFAMGVNSAMKHQNQKAAKQLTSKTSDKKSLGL